jgi:hypothetical protein
MGDLFGVNDYKMSDLVFYIGLFGGIILTNQLLLGVVETGLFRLIIGAVVGIGLGWALGLVYSALQKTDGPGRDGE